MTSRTFERTSAQRAGDDRLRQLKQWIAADKERGDARLTLALNLWRNEVQNRLHGKAPHIMKIPNCFVKELGLESQHVMMDEQGAVYELFPNSHVIKRLLIAAPKLLMRAVFRFQTQD